jgi:putative DNA methylase
MPAVTHKKLIEVALPLEAIDKASARTVIFAQMVDDPSSHPDIFPTEKAQDKERRSNGRYRLTEPIQPC